MQRRNDRIGQTLHWRRGIVLAVLLLSAALSGPDPERIGDRLQIALPVLGLGCAALTGGAGEYLLRFAAMEGVLHASKRGLGEAAINRRPNGGTGGFPSGHTAAATFGAATLARECLQASPLAQGAVILAAAFTGASRIETGAHDIWQVLAGAVLGWAGAGLFRRRCRAWQSTRNG